MKNELKGIIVKDKKYFQGQRTFYNAIISFLEVNLYNYEKGLKNTEKELEKIEKRENRKRKI